jgi:hypothetical protein
MRISRPNYRGEPYYTSTVSARIKESSQPSIQFFSRPFLDWLTPFREIGIIEAVERGGVAPTRRVIIRSRQSGTLCQSKLSPAADRRTAHPDRDNRGAEAPIDCRGTVQ